nr:hypothetical protein [Tanacetum cinerariifolium]
AQPVPARPTKLQAIGRKGIPVLANEAREGPQAIDAVGGIEAELRQRGQADTTEAVVGRFSLILSKQTRREADTNIEVYVAAQHQLYLLRVALGAVLPGIVAH